MESPLKYFADLRDPRVERTREHLLEEILWWPSRGDFERGQWVETEDRRLLAASASG